MERFPITALVAHASACCVDTRVDEKNFDAS
jgi:hypothetical protein